MLGCPFLAIVMVQAAVPQEWEVVLQQTSVCGASGKSHAARFTEWWAFGAVAQKESKLTAASGARETSF